MSVTGQIDRIKFNVSDSYDALEAKGATMPTEKNSDNLPRTIESIITGGGGSTNAERIATIPLDNETLVYDLVDDITPYRRIVASVSKKYVAVPGCGNCWLGIKGGPRSTVTQCMIYAYAIFMVEFIEDRVMIGTMGSNNAQTTQNFQVASIRERASDKKILELTLVPELVATIESGAEITIWGWRKDTTSGEPGRGVASIVWSEDTKKWVITYTDSSTSEIDGPEIPETLSELSGDSTHRTVTDVEKETWNSKSDFSGSYNDLTNKPTIPAISTSTSSTSTTTAASSSAVKSAYDKANAAMPKYGGTFTGTIHAGASYQSYSSYLLRQSRLSTSELTPTNNGEICWVYE